MEMDRHIGSIKTSHLFNTVLFKTVEIRMIFIIFSILQNFVKIFMNLGASARLKVVKAMPK